MGTGAEWAAGAAIVSAIIGTGASVAQSREQKKANRAQRAATAEARRIEELQRQAEARERYRQMRRDRAATLQQTEYLGAADSTSGIGAVNTTRTAYNISAGFSNATNAIANRMNAFTDAANRYNYRGQRWGAISNTAWNVASISSSIAGREGWTGLGNSLGFGQTATTDLPDSFVRTSRTSYEPNVKMGGLY